MFAGIAILQERFIYSPAKAATEPLASGRHRAWLTPEVFGASWLIGAEGRAARPLSFTAMRGTPDTVRFMPRRLHGGAG